MDKKIVANIIKTHIFRLKPKQKLVAGILKYCQKNKIKSAVVLSMIGSLNNIEIGYLKKLPGQYITKKYRGPLELVNCTGTIAQKDGKTILHLHITVSTDKAVHAGHLVEAEIFSTAEIVLGELDNTIERYLDNYTGLNELK